VSGPSAAVVDAGLESRAWGSAEIGDWWPRAAALIALALAWEAVGRLVRFPFLPPLTSVLSALWALTVDGEILGSLAWSLASLVVGYALAAALGLALGAVMARHPAIDSLLDPYVGAMLAAPNLVFVPVLAALLGAGRATQVAVVFLYAFFLITATTAAALRMADAVLVDMARSFGAADRQLFWKVLVPGSAPLIFAGLRIGVVRAVKGMIGGEMLVAMTGLGALARTYGSRFDAERALAILLVITAVALVGARLIEALERRMVGGSRRP
jgi:ABC-type nitrate/sulfonate/bicarbonate transport system permease component